MSEFRRQLVLFRMFENMTHEMLGNITDSDFTAIPFGGGNSPNWILGHLTVSNAFSLSLCGVTEPLVQEWMPIYGPGSTPSDDASQIASRNELTKQFKRTCDEVVAAVETVTVEFLDDLHQAPFLRSSLPTNGDLLGHLVNTHFALHVGQLSAWRRARGMESVLDLAKS